MSANTTTAAPTGRKKLAQGNNVAAASRRSSKEADPSQDGSATLGNPPPNTSSPEGAKEGGELPKGWARLAMGEVGRWFGGGTPSKANPRFWTGGKIPWVSPKDMKFDLITDAQDHITEDAVAQSATNLVEAGSILIVVRSGILKHTLPVAVAQRQVALNQDLKAVKPLENIRSDYLALALKTFERDILHTCTKTGTTVQSLELPVFLRFKIPVAPLPEQRRIVAEIEKQFTRLEAGVAALRRVQANLKRYRAAVLKAACEGRLVPTEAELTAKNPKSTKSKPASLSASSALSAVKNPGYETGAELLARILTERRQNWQGRGQYKEPAAPDTANLPPLPDGWTWATVEQLSEVVRGSSPRPAGDPRYFGGNVPWITVGPLTADNSPYLKQVEASLNELGREHSRYIEPQTLLFTNSGATLGVPKITLIGGCINDGVAALLGVSYPLKLYLLYFLRTQTERLRGVNQGAAQPNLNTTIIKAINVPLAPLAEQTRIVAEVERRLSVVEELESVVSANLQRASRLRQSILQKAFTGELV